MRTKWLLVVAMLGIVMTMNAENSRDYIRNKLRSVNTCTSVAITKFQGDAMIYGRNGYACKRTPEGFAPALQKLNEDSIYVYDIQITEGGRWLIQHGRNGVTLGGEVYPGMVEQMQAVIDAGDSLMMVAMDDTDGWFLMSDTHYNASNNEILQWILRGVEKYGRLRTVTLTDEVRIAVFEKGMLFAGELPEDLKQALVECKVPLTKVRVSGQAWFIVGENNFWKCKI